jgi:hypothetical protein
MKAIKGYYLNLETFISLHHSENSLFTFKKEWDASKMKFGLIIKGENQITTCIRESKRCAGKI